MSTITDPSALTDNQKKTLYYRYFSIISPYDASFTSIVDITSLPSTEYINEYSVFKSFRFTNTTLSAPYYCPYPYYINNDASFQLKTVYDKALSLSANSISFTNSIRSGSITMNYIGTSKPFDNVTNAASNFTDLISKIKMVTDDAQYFLSSSITIPTLTVTSSNIIYGNVQVGPVDKQTNIHSEESTYGSYGLYLNVKPGDADFRVYNRDTSTTASITQPTGYGDYFNKLRELVTVLSNIRNNNNFKSINDSYQPKQRDTDKRVDEVFDIIILSLKQSIIALRSSYQTINIERSATINGDRQYIDAQMKELLQLPGTQIDNYKQYYTSTMVAGVMWTVLATSLVYYVFSEL